MVATTTTTTITGTTTKQCQDDDEHKCCHQLRPIITFLDRCRAVVQDQPDEIFASWHNVNGQKTKSYTFQEIWNEAGLIAYHLRCVWNVEKGERVILCYDFGLHFFVTFLACLRAGVVAVLVYPPFLPLTKTLPKMNKTVQDCQPVMVLTDSRLALLRRADIVNPLSKSRRMWPNLPYKETDTLLLQSSSQVLRSHRFSRFFARKSNSSICGQVVEQFDDEDIVPEDLAFLQYTSGSTGDPKGVMVTHGSFSANIQLTRDIFTKSPAVIQAMKDVTTTTTHRCKVFSWLPQYHDLGLVQGICSPFVMGFRLYMMSPLDFIHNPILWMEYVTKFGINLIMGPNFSFDLVARRYRTLQDQGKAPKKIDLSTIFCVMNCSEPIRTNTLDNFQETFRPYGLKENCISGAYGLAETVVCGCFCYGRHESSVVHLSRRPRLVAVGHKDVMFSSTFKIVDPNTRREVTNDGVAGEIWISGPSIAGGYYGKKELSEEVFRAVLADDDGDDDEEEEKEEEKYSLVVVALEEEHSEEERTEEEACFENEKHSLAVILDDPLKSAAVNDTIVDNIEGQHNNGDIEAAATYEYEIDFFADEDVKKDLFEVTLDGPLLTPSKSSTTIVDDSGSHHNGDIESGLPPAKLIDNKGGGGGGGEQRKEVCVKHKEKESLEVTSDGTLTPSSKLQHSSMDDSGSHHNGDIESAAIPVKLAKNQGGKEEEDNSYKVTLPSTTNVDDSSGIDVESAFHTALVDDQRIEAKEYFFHEEELELEGVSVDPLTPSKLRQSTSTMHHDSDSRQNGDILDIPDERTTYLRTGDLGFFENGYLFVCGRIKDLIIVNGVNYYPQDIEFGIQEAFPSVRPGSIAAFSADETANDGELEVVFEIRKQQEANASEVCRQIQLFLASNIGLSASKVVAIPEKTICKTTSGKIQRRAIRKKFHEGNFEIVGYLSSGVSKPQSLPPQADAESLSLSENSCTKSTDDMDDSQATMSFDGLLQHFFGIEVDEDATWEELGLTSLGMVELKTSIEGSFSVVLAADCFEVYPTPHQLGNLVQRYRGEPLEANLERLECVDFFSLSWAIMTILQAVGSLLHVLMLSAGIVPAYEISKLVVTERTSELVDTNGVYVIWMWIPVGIPAWMATFTLLVILSKWIIVGRYREGEMATTSVAFLRWWWVDRAVHIFEVWVGRFIQDTPLIWFVYSLMGAKIHPSASIDSTIREFDLVKIGPTVSLQHQLRCRKFGPWLDSNPPILRFRAVQLERSCQVKGMVSLGAHIGKGATVSKRAVIPEGGQVPENMHVSGNPAFIDGQSKPTDTSNRCWWGIGIVKLVWLLVELYVFFASIFAAQIVWNDRIPPGWRYERLTHWFLLIITSNIILLLLGIPLKWIFIGKRKPGKAVSRSPWSRLSEWMTDYHFRISTYLLASITSGSTFWNLILMLYGMDVDLMSRVYVDSFPPSKVDLIKVKRSFLASTTFDNTRDDGTYALTTIEESSIGHQVHFGPGVHISKAIVPLLSLVQSDIRRPEHDRRFQVLSPLKVFGIKVMSEIFYLLFFPLAWASLIPSFEVWTYTGPESVWMTVPVLATCLIVQTCSWVVMLRLLEVLQFGFGYRSLPFLPFYPVYLSISYSVQHWSMLATLWGTPHFNAVAQFLGVRVQGSALYFGRSLHDFHQLTFGDKVIIDGAISFGHAVVYGELTYGPNHLSGVYHDFTLNTMWKGKDHNSYSAVEEHGPYRSLIGSTSREELASVENQSVLGTKRWF